MNQLRKLYLLLKEIGVADLVSYSLYQAQLRNGPTRQLTPPGGMPSFAQFSEPIAPEYCWRTNWEHLSENLRSPLMKEEALLLKDGIYRPFYAAPQPLLFTTSSQSSTHWIDVNEEIYDDIKMEWEPARFNWSLPLAGAYNTSADESIVEYFWLKFAEFDQSNPVNTGPNWVSAQEVGIRAIMWMLAASAFHASARSTPQRVEMLTAAVRRHVERILPTLDYARSQHNNHILSESMCLMLAGDFLSDLDPRAREWCRQGEKDFNRALLRQVNTDGTYAQHSANYHRLMLQLALLYHARMRKQGRQLPQTVQQKLAAATRWMIAQLDPTSGRLPNLGHNDGTLLLPFGSVEYRDYRPTAQAAAIAFLGQPCLATGVWDELARWLEMETGQLPLSPERISSPAVHKVGIGDTWGSLRGVRFRNRPAHADQLHADLWWRGINIARDAGTYSYNLPPPWQNALDRTGVHNTIIINDHDQMERMSRFLWLDHAQARWMQNASENITTASHNGYQRLGVTHQRTLQYKENSGFVIQDLLIQRNRNGKALDYCLHWLLPDWPWQLHGETLVLSGPQFTITITVSARVIGSDKPLSPGDVSVIHAGETLSGTRKDAILGWESDTYGEKHPAISFSLLYNSPEAIALTTRWEFIDAIC